MRLISKWALIIFLAPFVLFGKLLLELCFGLKEALEFYGCDFNDDVREYD